MKKVGILVCLVIVVAMDVAAGILGINAEVAKDKVIHMRLMRNSGCKEPIPDAFKLGLAATSSHALAHILANFLGGCLCIFCTEEELERSAANRKLCFGCLISSWIVVAIGFPMMIIGMLENFKLKDSCGILHNHLLLIGGICCFLHSLLFCIIAYYVCNPANESNPAKESNPTKESNQIHHP